MRYSDKDLINKLKNMPKLQDSMDKNIIYQQISSKLDSNKKRRKVNLVPLISTLLAAAIIFLAVPSLFKMVQLENEGENSVADKAMDYSQSNQEANKSINELQQEDSSDMQEAESEIRMMNQPMESYVINEIGTGMKVARSAVADQKLQYVIPISFIIPESKNLSAFYNEMEHQIHEGRWGVSDYLFEDVSFSIDDSSKEVIINFPKDFSLGEGSAHAQIFEKMLVTMFYPDGINKAVFNSTNNQDVDLGPLGSVNGLTLSQESKASYKLYRGEDAERSFLIPIQQKEKITIDEALVEMETGDENYNIMQTIPDRLEYTTEDSGDRLKITFSDKDTVKNNQDFLTMIEAILMTAKTFGYETVTFDNTVNKDIGPYNLREPVPVPMAINRINQ